MTLLSVTYPPDDEAYAAHYLSIVAFLIQRRIQRKENINECAMHIDVVALITRISQHSDLLLVSTTIVGVRLHRVSDKGGPYKRL